MTLSSQDTQAYQQAVSAYINGSYEEAAAITELLIETRSGDPNLQLLLGHIYCCLQRLDMARAHYQIVLALTSDPELVECVNNSLRGIHQSGALQDRTTETSKSCLDPVSSATDILAVNSSLDALNAENLDEKNSNSTNLNPASPVIIEPNRAKSNPVFVDPFSGNPALSSNIDVPASHEATQTSVDDYLKNYPVDVYDDLGELPNFGSTEASSGQSEHESALTPNTETGPSQLDSKQTNLFAVPDEVELLESLEHQSNTKVQTPSTLTDSQFIKPQSEPRGAFASLKNTSLKTKQCLAAIATGIISAAAVMAVSQVPRTNVPQASTVPHLAESGLAAAAAGIAGGVASFTLGQMTTHRIKRATSDLQAKFDAVLQGDFKPQVTTYSDDEWGHLAASFDQMIDVMNQNGEAEPTGEQAIVNEGSLGDLTR